MTLKLTSNALVGTLVKTEQDCSVEQSASHAGSLSSSGSEYDSE